MKREKVIAEHLVAIESAAKDVLDQIKDANSPRRERIEAIATGVHFENHRTGKEQTQCL